MITLGTVNISDKTKELLNQALEQGIIGQGKYIQDFERELASFFNVKHVIATANGTLADAVSLAAAKAKDNSERNEVIAPALTFVAQINSIYYNHLNPVFVDVGYDYQIDVAKIEEKITDKTLAIMPAHLLGRPANMAEIRKLAEKHNLFVIEDSCEALGSKYRGQFCGTIGDLGCFSFFVSHAITTGEGGAIATNSESLAELARSLRNHGRQSDKPEEKFIFPYLGFSAKMNALEAIVGLGVIDKLPEYVAMRNEHFKKLNELLGRDDFKEEEGEYIVPHCYPVMAQSRQKRDEILRLLPQQFGVEARQIFCSIPTQCPAYRFLKETLGSYPVAEDIGQRGFYVPCHQNLAEQDLIKIAQALKEVLK